MSGNEINYIHAHINKFFEVNLESMTGSTNYAWAITKMPDSVFLFFTEITPTVPGAIAPVNQKFVFAFNGTVDSESKENTIEAKIEFSLLNLSTPSYSGNAKKITITVRVDGDDIVKQSDLSGFVEFNEHIAKYSEKGSDIPPIFKYNYPVEECCICKYNFPTESCVSKYNYPVEECCICKYNFPAENCISKYNFPTESCISKYNYPVEECCICKYSYPVMKYDYPFYLNSNNNCCK